MRQSLRANCLGVLGFTSLSIHQATACGTSDYVNGPLGVRYAKLDAAVVAEIEFGKIAMQMRFAAMLVDALRAALEYGPHALNCVGVNVALHVFALGMVDRRVSVEFFAQLRLDRAFIGMEYRLAGHVLDDDATNLFRNKMLTPLPAKRSLVHRSFHPSPASLARLGKVARAAFRA